MKRDASDQNDRELPCLQAVGMGSLQSKVLLNLVGLFKAGTIVFQCLTSCNFLSIQAANKMI